MDYSSLLSSFDPVSGAIAGRPRIERRLSDLRGCFADIAAYDAALARDNALVYSVSSVEPAGGDGQLHYGVGVVMPGRIGSEYFLTKGHLHAWRPAAEFYFGLHGEGLMLLERESDGQSQVLPLRPSSAVYVPGFTAHRTVNTGRAPLVYIGVYPAAAGHDYGAIAQRNFNKVIVESNGTPRALDRADLLAALAHKP